MRRNAVNFIAASFFFLAALRDAFFPGALQIHPNTSDDSAVWFVMGCVCIAAGMARPNQAKRRA